MLLNSGQGLLERLANDVYLIFREITVKGQGNRTLADRFCDGEVPRRVTVLLYEEGLQMDRRKVIAGLNTLMPEFV